MAEGICARSDDTVKDLESSRTSGRLRNCPAIRSWRSIPGGRLSYFTSSGTFIRSFPVPRLPGASAPQLTGWLDDGTLLINALTRSPSRDTRDQSTYFLYAVDRNGEVLGTLGDFAGQQLGRNGYALAFGGRAEFAAGGDPGLVWPFEPIRVGRP